MSYHIIITKQAKRDIDGLESVVKTRLGKKLKQVSQLEDVKPVLKQLVNDKIGSYRLRIGDYRVLLDLDNKNIVILKVQHRKDVYR
jgi:mRNA interferase RelE/StbE